MKSIAAPFLFLILSTLSAAAQPSGGVVFPPVTGEAETLPIIQFVTYRLNSPAPNGADWEFIVDIHFIASQGNATTLHMQLVKAPCCYHLGSVPITIPAEAQKSGAIASAHLVIGHCGGPDTVTTEANIVDAKGNHSNSVRFSTHCQGNSHGSRSRIADRQSLPTFDQQVQVSPGNYVDTPVPHTGTEAALRNYIEGTEKGETRAEFMSPSAAPETPAQSATIKKLLESWGSLKTITFKAVDEQGFDTYLAEFEHGEYVWTVPQLAADGKLVGFAFRPSTTRSTPAATHAEQPSSVPAQ